MSAEPVPRADTFDPPAGPLEPAPVPPPVPPPPPPPADDKPWWESTGFRTLFPALYTIWLPFLHAWLEGLIGLAYAIAVETSIVVILGFFGINIMTRQAEARGRQQMVGRRRG